MCLWNILITITSDKFFLISCQTEPTSASDDEPQQEENIKWYGHNHTPISPLVKDEKQNNNLDNYKE